jgi:Flp pilus assembly protein TadG
MKLNNEYIVGRLRYGQRGQTIVLLAISLIALVGVAGFLIDVGRLYYAYQDLKAATQAAALAGGYALSLTSATVSSVQTDATSYSAANNDLNANSNLTSVTVTATPECLTSSFLPQCGASTADKNAVVVTEQAAVPTFFARVVGLNSWTIAATATASARGGTGGPYNVAIVLDTTHSMGDDDSDSACSNTRLYCALEGIRALLGAGGAGTGLSPCSSTSTSCGSATTSSGYDGETAYNVANPLDEVALMVFPGLASASDAPNDYTGSCTMPSGDITSYNNGPIYQVVPLSSDYRVSDTGALNASSEIVIAAGGGSCSGVSAPGGEGTFYAGAIDAAQAMLVAETRPNTKNVIILLSDGDATASGNAGYIGSSSPGCTTKGSGDMAGCATSYLATNECHQAITEAQKATAAGTTVYAVAYGTESSGCTTDSPAITPCETMQQIASSSQTFFSDGEATSICASASRPTTSMSQIFTDIGEDLSAARLIPNGTT